MTTIDNEILSVQISPKGAELQAIQRKDNHLEYLWSGDAAFWGKKSPVLFPIVGGLKNNQYRFNGKTYELGRHGFARDKIFELTEQTPHSATFVLTDDGDTLARYPFPFTLSIRYAVNDATLTVRYTVQNTGDQPMYFSIGAHPAFRVPLAEGTHYHDYALHFNAPENAALWPLSPEGQILDEPVAYFDNSQELPLTKELFLKDALVFKHLASNAISLRSDKTPHGLELRFPGFPYMGIWAAPNADFVCIEPWYGIADHVSASGDITRKEGIIELAPEAIFQREWSAVFF
ncbi:aldose 1-epimerase family protein [Chitinophaga rhizosphaerae]|uniref:aldose 1-epimerase family protein n=1 Tax=Chitinophaga rhizosphaerae TaxID=1864947 RepID=UPI000F81540C|nr:aldose 1-epimerase family protein [Chitinophaga rhizosphaerae]